MVEKRSSGSSVEGAGEEVRGRLTGEATAAGGVVEHATTVERVVEAGTVETETSTEVRTRVVANVKRGRVARGSRESRTEEGEVTAVAPLTPTRHGEGERGATNVATGAEAVGDAECQLS